jgi:hypothetical protein
MLVCYRLPWSVMCVPGKDLARDARNIFNRPMTEGGPRAPL